MTIADSIRAAAEKRGLSVYRIAKDTGLNQSGLNRFFNGTRDTLTSDVADTLMEYFDLEIRPKRSTKTRRK